MADLVVQAFAALILLFTVGLSFLLWLNRKQDRELEQSYEPGFRPQDFINALAVCTNRVCRTTKNFVDSTISSVGDIARKVPTPMPVAIHARSVSAGRIRRQ